MSDSKDWQPNGQGQDRNHDNNISREVKIASRVNENLMRMLQKALDADPAADLRSIFPKDYAERIGRQQKAEVAESAAAELNRAILGKLQNRFANDPEFDLLLAIPHDYEPVYAELKHPKAPPAEKGGTEDIRSRLSPKDQVSVLSPLSETVEKLLAKFEWAFVDTSHTLAASIIDLLRGSQVLYNFFSTRMVLKCSDNVVAKITGHDDTTEYSTLQYLQDNLPDFPAPKPHGLVRIGSKIVLFMSYIPSITLRDAWPKLTHENKISIQIQLQKLFTKLRTLRQLDGHLLGGVGGEGVQDDRLSFPQSNQHIRSAADFENLRYSDSRFGSRSYVQFLRNFLPEPAKESVFSHGDARTANIMVERDENGLWTVRGIIDWEHSGFYPDYFESTSLTRTLNAVDDDDWYLYLPSCIAPTEFALSWFVDRVWDRHPQWT